MSSDGMESVTVSMPPELVDLIESRLTYNDSRAGWIREACHQRLERDSGEALQTIPANSHETDE